MAKKKTKKKLEFKCCGEDDHSCGKDCKCNDDKVEVFVCPRCQSVDVGYAFELKNIFGIIPRMKCKSCGFSGTTFPKWIIDQDKLTKEHKPIDLTKQKKKDKKIKRVSFKEVIDERYCPHCKDNVRVSMKDGSVDTFVCENCQFEINDKRKKK